jgi:hypothetical protein
MLCLDKGRGNHLSSQTAHKYTAVCIPLHVFSFCLTGFMTSKWTSVGYADVLIDLAYRVSYLKPSLTKCIYKMVNLLKPSVNFT